MPPAVPFSLFTFWRETLVLFAAYGVVILFIAMAIIDRVFVRAFERCKDTIMSRLNEWYKDRMARVDEKLVVVDVHDDEMIAIKESLLAQGRALAEQLSQHFTNNTRAMQTVTDTLGAIQKEANEMGKAISRIEGRMEGGEWDGVNRRRKTRRKSSNGDPS